MFPIPDFKGFDFFPHGTRINFMRAKGLCLALSLFCMLGSLLAIGLLGFNYGVDFKGGTLIEVQSKAGPATAGAGVGLPGGGGLMDMLGPMLDTNRDGSMMDDVAGMLGKVLGGR